MKIYFYALLTIAYAMLSFTGLAITSVSPDEDHISHHETTVNTALADIPTPSPMGGGTAPLELLDFGDAPNGPYPTLLANDGARHIIDGSTFLGNNVDAEPDGLPNINATGDDLDNIYDEDGVTFISPYVVGKTAEVKVRASKTGFLNAWIDFNLNGSWAETNEHIFIDQALVAGINTLTFNIPPASKPGVSYIRFRFDTYGGLNYYGPAENGEVEDYKLIIYPPDWEYTPTGSSHIISTPKLVTFNCLSLSAGDFLGTFYTDENGNIACGGAAVWDSINNQTIVAFGDDITTTPLKEGFSENEDFLWKAYFSSTGVEEEILATYSLTFPNSDGKFHDNGISELSSLTKKLDVSASVNPDSICVGNVVQLNALVYGGCGTNTFSWISNPVGFTSSLQNPTATPSQNTTYTLTVTNTYGDSVIAAVDVVVFPFTEPTCPDDFEICIDEGPVTLTGGLPLGGTYSGTGVTSGVFYPGTAGAGSHIITYTYVEPGTNCAGSCDFKITVNPLPVMDCPPFMEACENDLPVLLNTGSPAGGEYTGTGVFYDGFNYFFDPGVGPNTYIINYCFTDPVTDCENCCEFNFHVYAKPGVTCPNDFTICYDTTPFVLSGGLPTGGTYSGTGVSGGMFYPATAGVGTHDITYTYVDPQTNCGDFCTFKLTVILVEATCPDDFEICIDEDPVTLSGGLPIGGSYSGTGVTAGVFYPGTAGAGSHIITYTYSEPGTNCPDSCNFNITVNPLPIMDCPPFMEVCEDDLPVLLNTGSPAGGEYTGTGVFYDGFNYFFDPGVGPNTYIINYCFTDPVTDCENCCEFSFHVYAKPGVTCPNDFTICYDTTPFVLSGGLPTGGTYSGTGVSGSMFYPATAGVGTHDITYTYVDPQTNCGDFCTFKITVIEVIVECPEDIIVCIDESPFVLLGGTPTGGIYSGTGVSGGMFFPGTAGVGAHTIEYTYGEPGTNCSGSCNFNITVNPLPVMDCPPFLEACEDDPPVLLSNSYPRGGDYTGTGVFFDGLNYFFDPGVGFGIYTLNYCFTNPATGCENCCGFNFIVHALPNVSCPENFAVCLDTPAFTLSGGSPDGGQYLGDGVSFDGTNYWFDPSIAGEGGHEVLYVYTNPQTFCSNMCSFIITVIEVPEVTCPENMMVCMNDDEYELTGATPVGGTYAGPGVSGGFFNPWAAGVGTHVITYTIGVAGTNCFGQCEFEITVKPLPGVDCPGDVEVCLYSPTVLLLDNAQPAATYSGEGVFFESGFYYFDPSIGLGEYEVTMCNTDPETQCTNCCTYLIAVIADQLISIPEGWSGVSSYIEPLNTDLNQILYPITYQLTILSNNEGIYWPGGNTFTLSDWDVYSGYVIKVSEGTELPFCGMEVAEKTIELNQGWNIIPVLTSYPYTTETLFNGVAGFEIAKEVAGTGVYWEQYGINTMPVLDPGKAYYVRMGAAGSLTFSLPLDELPSFDPVKPSELISPWNEIISTPGSHTIVFNLPGLMLEQGDLIGGFTPEGQCAGVVGIEDVNKAFVLNLNGDDVLTSGKEGFDAGEYLSYKLYRATTGETFELTVSYNHDMNTGQFEAFGLSEITSLKLSATGISGVSINDVVIYPNPSNGIFNIEGISINATLAIFNAFGEEIMGNELIRKGTIDLNSQPNGVYFVRIKTSNESFVKKLVKE